MKLVWVLLFAALTFSADAQINRRNKGRSNAGKNSAADLPLSERIYFGGGGNFGGGYTPDGYRYTYISVSPLVGYRITLPFSAGVGINYINFRFPDLQQNLTQYGASPFVRYQFGRLFAYAEYSILSVPSLNSSVERAIYTRLPIGLGYSLPIGKKAAVNAMALYDVLYSKSTSHFYSPWVIRVFFSAGAISF